MKKTSKKGIEALVILLGVLIVVLTYFLGVLKIKEETASLETSNRLLKVKAEAYETLFNSVNDYNSQIKQFKEDEEKLENNFVYGISTTDQIMYITNLEGSNRRGQLALNYFNLGEGTAVTYEPVAEQNPTLAAAGLSNPQVVDDGKMLAQYPMDFGFEVSYDGFKDMINYLNTVGGSKSIESVSLSFNSSTGLMSGTISLYQYVLLGTDHEYVPLAIPYVSTTVDNIFGTVDAPVLAPATQSDSADSE